MDGLIVYPFIENFIVLHLVVQSIPKEVTNSLKIIFNFHQNVLKKKRKEEKLHQNASHKCTLDGEGIPKLIYIKIKLIISNFTSIGLRRTIGSNNLIT